LAGKFSTGTFPAFIYQEKAWLRKELLRVVVEENLSL
jgi:hypothetical protein